MNFIEERLLSAEKRDNINIVHFNPWLVNNDEALLREFFKTIMLDTDEKVKRLLEKYGSLAIFASKTVVNAIAPGIGTALQSFLTNAKKVFAEKEDTLQEYKDKVSRALKYSDRHLLIMIDDVDRLDKDELHSVFRLIRQVADFENCIYLVTMDVEMVSKSISEFYGEGTSFDGRKFLDKIVQVPITIPKVPQVEMKRIIRERLMSILSDYLKEESSIVDKIVDEIYPLIDTQRVLCRYCNQLRFVLPNLLGEVDLKDLCILELIKAVSETAYGIIYDNRLTLTHEIDVVMFIRDEKKEKEERTKRYEETLTQIGETVEASKQLALKKIVENLFTRDLSNQEAITCKSITTSIYFPKYFVGLVPSDLIPDSILDEYSKGLLGQSVKEVTSWIDDKVREYSQDEVERALTYLVTRGEEHQVEIASLLSKALSLSTLAKGFPHETPRGNNSALFLIYQILRPIMFEQDPIFAGYNVKDMKVLNDTVGYILDHAEMNYSIYFFNSFLRSVTSETYDVHDVLGKITGRFIALPFETQIKYSKLFLREFFGNWQDVDETGFDAFAQEFIIRNDILQIMNRFIEDREAKQDIQKFASLFRGVITEINRKIRNLSTEEKTMQSVRFYLANSENA